MSTIDNLGFHNYQRFASDQADYEVFKKELHLDGPQLIESNFISSQVEIVRQKPSIPELVNLMGVDQKRTWAHFEAPDGFFNQRTNSKYVVSTLGPPSYQEVDIQKLENYMHDISNEMRSLLLNRSKLSPIEYEKQFVELKNIKKEGLKLLRTIHKGILAANEMVDFVQGRMMQYLQG